MGAIALGTYGPVGTGSIPIRIVFRHRAIPPTRSRFGWILNWDLAGIKKPWIPYGSKNKLTYFKLRKKIKK